MSMVVVSINRVLSVDRPPIPGKHRKPDGKPKSKTEVLGIVERIGARCVLRFSNVCELRTILTAQGKHQP